MNPRAAVEPPSRYVLEICSGGDLGTRDIEAAQTLLAKAYYESKMPAGFTAGLKADPSQLVVRAFSVDCEIVGVAVIKELAGASNDVHLDSDRRYYFKHFCVEPSHRGRGLGAAVIAIAREAAFVRLSLPVLWSASSEIGALALYVRSGALLYEPDVHGWNEKQSARENADLLRFFMSAPEATAFRLPNDVRFCWPADADAEEALTSRGFSRYAAPIRGVRR